MNRRALIAGSGALAIASLLPTDPTYAEKLSPDGRLMVRRNDRWMLVG